MYKLLCGDVMEQLRLLEDNSVNNGIAERRIQKECTNVFIVEKRL